MWIIKPSGLYSSITITVTALGSERGYDYLYLLNGGSVNAPALASLSGTASNAVYTTNGPAAVVAFVSDSGVVATGFTLTYAAQQCYQGCSGAGSCVNNACVCNAGRYGTYCQLTSCCTSSSCGAQGTCSVGASCECQCSAS